MKLTVGVKVPPQVVIGTEKLAEMIGPELVVAMLNDGTLQAGQKRNVRGNKPRSVVSAADVAVAQNELASARSELDELLKEATR